MFSLHSLCICIALFYCPCISIFTTGVDFFQRENICEMVTCAKLDISDCDGGYVKQISSLCECGVCVKYVGEGENCEGTEVRAECKEGLKCVNGKCATTSNMNCESNLNYKKKLIKEGKVSKELWLPNCTSSGLYKKTQVTASKGICVDENGQTIFGQEEKVSAVQMTCECSYYLSQKKEREKSAWANGPIERCTSGGDYESLQCVDDMCYCADKSTGKAEGLVTHIKQWELLPCYDAAKHGVRYESVCESEMFRVNSLKHQFSKKGVRLLGIRLAECEPDGTFSPKQCLTNICYCVDEKGFSFDVYKAEKDRSADMSCRCARDKYLIQTRHLQYPDLRCDDRGNYYPLQQIDQEYFCYSEEGYIIAEYGSGAGTYEEMKDKCDETRELLSEKIHRKIIV